MKIFLTKENIGRPRCRWLLGNPIFKYLNENERVRETAFCPFIWGPGRFFLAKKWSKIPWHYPFTVALPVSPIPRVRHQRYSLYRSSRASPIPLAGGPHIDHALQAAAHTVDDTEESDRHSPPELCCSQEPAQPGRHYRWEREKKSISQVSFLFVSETCFMIVENLPVSVKIDEKRKESKNLGKPSCD